MAEDGDEVPVHTGGPRRKEPSTGMDAHKNGWEWDSCVSYVDIE